MYKKKLFAVLMACVCLFVLSVPAFAVESRASDQIRIYSMGATTNKGSIEVSFEVYGKTKMNKLGCQSISVYEKSGSKWVLVESYDEDDVGMSKTSSSAHMNTIYCDMSSGKEYQVVVTVFAENSAGRDTRSDTFYVP